MDAGKARGEVRLFAVFRGPGLRGEHGAEGAAEAKFGECKGKVGPEEEACQGG